MNKMTLKNLYVIAKRCELAAASHELLTPLWRSFPLSCAAEATRERLDGS